MKKIIRRRDSRAKQIDVEEDAIKDTAKDIIPTSSVTNVKNMAIIQRLSSREKGVRNDQPSLG